MIPEGVTVPASAAEQELGAETSRTYRLDLANGRIAGMVDGVDAVRQAAFKILQTERFDYLIYDGEYGCELRAVIGLPGVIASSELERLIREALLADDRITDVRNLKMERWQDETRVQFDVVTTTGSFAMEKEVSGFV
ncbi:DUF2634 domain-containing protein [Gorillibacterium sp. sgz500922]|uniref:DUF2634 domain-containing protein n=1 Tax=Gorillibacterium sp. sgz500922 TaxID=3446694 RepID=UPI003F660E21